MTAAPMPVAAGAPRTLLLQALAAATAVGVLDGVAASLLHVVVRHATTVECLFQGIAGAVIGERAFGGGAATVTLGVALHCAVAYGWAADRAPRPRAARRERGASVAPRVSRATPPATAASRAG